MFVTDIYCSMRNRWNLRKKKTNLCARKNKSVHSSFSMFVDLLTIDVNSNDNSCYECSNLVMHVLTSSFYRINRYRLFDLISQNFGEKQRKSLWIVLTVVGTNTIDSWSSSFIDLNKEKKCLNLNLDINNLKEACRCFQNELNKVSKNNYHVVFGIILMIDFRFVFMTFPFTSINICQLERCIRVKFTCTIT